MAKLEPGESNIEGTGCFAGQDFDEGEIVGEYTGKRIFEDVADEKYEDVKETYLFDLGDGTVIDATKSDNPVKYINHSCDPNCESEQVDDRVFIVALRDIKKGEELTYDYNLIDEDDENMEVCNCGAPNCRGNMREPEE